MTEHHFDVVGVGANSVDSVYCLPEFPRPDGPASKLRISRHAVLCGGQTTTALCTCAAMGLRTKYVGAIGNDGNGARMRRELQRRGVDIEHAYVRDVPNPFAVILIDGRRGERVVLWDRDAALQLRPGEIDTAIVAGSRLIHVDDADEDAAIRAAARGRSAGIPVTSDIERVTERTEELIAAVTIPIFAEHVLEPLTGERDVERALRAVRRQRVRLIASAKASAVRRSFTRRRKPDTTYEPRVPLPPSRALRASASLAGAFGGGGKPDTTYEHDMLCVTLGARGAMLLEGDRLHQVPGCQVEVIDTTGAGDVFRGAFITALLRGDSPAEILRFANAAAAISCTRLGAMDGVPTVEEVESFSTTKHTKNSNNTQ